MGNDTSFQVVLAEHNDHLTVARILLNSETSKLGLGLSIPHLSVIVHNFTEPDAEFDSYLYDQCLPPQSHPLQQQPQPQQTQPIINSATSIGTPSLTLILNDGATSTPKSDDQLDSVPVDVQCDVSLTVNDELNTTPVPGPAMSVSHVVKGLIRFLSQETSQPLWNYEDITAKGKFENPCQYFPMWFYINLIAIVWSIKSVEQITCFLKHILKVYADSYTQARIAERWAQTALQLGLSCSSRHYAGRSLQVFRGLNVPINSRMLSDILSRLVETVAEQGEDMQVIKWWVYRSRTLQIHFKYIPRAMSLNFCWLSRRPSTAWTLTSGRSTSWRTSLRVRQIWTTKMAQQARPDARNRQPASRRWLPATWWTWPDTRGAPATRCRIARARRLTRRSRSRVSVFNF